MPSRAVRLNFKTTFYYVCYDAPENASSASAVSSVVESCGGAGYVVNCNGKYYVTVACYYAKNDAEAVCSSLKNRGINCVVLEVFCDNLKLNGSAKKNAEKYEGNLKTLLSLSKICYELANSLDNLTQGQDGARKILYDVKTDLEGLSRLNSVNCFSKDLAMLCLECADAADGYIFPRSVRRLQIAICDVIANINIY